MSSFDLNKVMLIGNVGKRPELRTFGDNENKKLVKFTLATNESWKNKQTGEFDTETQWHNIVCFNSHLCDFIMKHVGVGTKVYLEGQSKTRSYEKDGVTRYINEIVLPMFGGDVKVLVRGHDNVDEDEPGPNEGGNDGPFNDDIPF